MPPGRRGLEAVPAAERSDHAAVTVGSICYALRWPSARLPRTTTGPRGRVAARQAGGSASLFAVDSKDFRPCIRCRSSLLARADGLGPAAKAVAIVQREDAGQQSAGSDRKPDLSGQPKRCRPRCRPVCAHRSGTTAWSREHVDIADPLFKSDQVPEATPGNPNQDVRDAAGRYAQSNSDKTTNITHGRGTSASYRLGVLKRD
jgi:hypothetical protein